jgi:hypothetical protein
MTFYIKTLKNYNILFGCGPIGDATSSTQPISMAKTSYHYGVEMGQIGHMCPRNLNK